MWKMLPFFKWLKIESGALKQVQMIKKKVCSSYRVCPCINTRHLVRTKHSGVWSSIMTFFPVGFPTPIDESIWVHRYSANNVNFSLLPVCLDEASRVTLSDAQASLSTFKVHINCSSNRTHVVAQEGVMSRRQAHHLLALFSWCRESNPNKDRVQTKKIRFCANSSMPTFK